MKLMSPSLIRSALGKLESIVEIRLQVHSFDPGRLHFAAHQVQPVRYHPARQTLAGERHAGRLSCNVQELAAEHPAEYRREQQQQRAISSVPVHGFSNDFTASRNDESSIFAPSLCFQSLL
jgi:hypothetical protein